MRRWTGAKPYLVMFLCFYYSCSFLRPMVDLPSNQRAKQMYMGQRGDSIDLSDKVDGAYVLPHYATYNIQPEAECSCLNYLLS